MGAQTAFVALAETSCCVCGVVFAIPQTMLDDLRNKGSRDFYCPNGHTLQFNESQNSKLKKELEREKQRREMAEREAKMEAERADKAEKLADRRKSDHDRTKKRLKAGLCPCCNRSFVNLKRHMDTKHPNFSSEP